MDEANAIFPSSRATGWVRKLRITVGSRKSTMTQLLPGSSSDPHHPGSEFRRTVCQWIKIMTVIIQYKSIN